METLSPSAALPEITACPELTSMDVEAPGTAEVSQFPASNQSSFPAAPVQAVCAKAGYAVPAIKQPSNATRGRRSLYHLLAGSHPARTRMGEFGNKHQVQAAWIGD
jgi:hypothetical protein